MSIDPEIGVWIGLVGSVVSLFVAGWISGVFHEPRKKEKPPVAAE